MDLLSLPEEKLANIARYTKFTTLRQIRKINKSIDSVAIRNNINRVPVDSVRLYKVPIVILYEPRHEIKIDNDKASLTLSEETFGPEKRYLTVNLEECLPKIKILQNLDIDDVHLDEQMLAMMKINSKSFRHVSYLTMSHVSCSLSQNILRSLFLEVFGRVDRLRFAMSISEAFCSIEVLGNRHWKYLSIEHIVGLGDPVPSLKKLIYGILPDCDSLYLYAEKTLTLKDTVNLLKKCILERGTYNQQIVIDEVMPGEITDNIETVKNLFQSNTEEIQDVVEISNQSYEVQFGSVMEGCEFRIHMEG